MISAQHVAKRFVLHNQGGAVIDVLQSIDLTAHAGEALVLSGPSGAGKSTLLRLLYGNYRCTAGRVLIHHRGEMIDITACPPRQLLDIRRHTLGWVSQFLRVIPRVSAIDIVTEPLLLRGVDAEEAQTRATGMLERLNLPKRLWHLAPSTFSGGEQQRVNIARCFVEPAPILLIDEPTASLDAANREVVVELIGEARARGSAIVGIFHDEAIRERVATRLLDLGKSAWNGEVKQ
jgi:alpha-D-ribose 1-methylphosphonate 5-triphosphate synthase subunit PhnL